MPIKSTNINSCCLRPHAIELKSRSCYPVVHATDVSRVNLPVGDSYLLRYFTILMGEWFGICRRAAFIIQDDPCRDVVGGCG